MSAFCVYKISLFGPPANTLFDLFKACVCYFFSNFYFFSIFIFLFFLSSFSSWGIQIFVFSSSPLFSPVSHCFRSWSKKNLKIYGVSNCLNENLITRFIWYLEKEIGVTLKLCPLIENWIIIFMGKSCRKYAPKAGPRPLFDFAK